MDKERSEFCRRNHLDAKIVNEVLLREEEVRTIMNKAGFLVPKDLTPTLSKSEVGLLLKVP